MFATIVAHDETYGIGYQDSIPWSVPEDMKHFRKTTINNVVIMGRKTYDSIREIRKPTDSLALPNRINIVISRTLRKYNDGHLLVFNEPWECVKWCKRYYNKKKMFVIGGESIYRWFLVNNLINEEYITYISGNYSCDTFYYAHNNYCRERVVKVISNDDKDELPHRIIHRRIKNESETKMLSIMKDILTIGNDKSDRTQTGTLSLFGVHMRYNLRDNTLPLMTTRRMFTRGIFEELMFYLRGETDTNILKNKKVNIWDANTTREFLDNRGLTHLPVGDMGHSYGFSFRHFGGEYKTCKDDYKGIGFDQLYYVIDEIKRNPNSRRLLINLWEPNNMHKAPLPPCLYGYQFYVHNGYISCMMSQRSSDFNLAGGWNVVTGALLTYLIAHYTGTKPSELIWNIGDAHIYKNSVNGATQQVDRVPNVYPKLFLQNMPEKIEDVSYANIDIVNYAPQAKINLPMNA